jgi:hypothetical protein
MRFPSARGSFLGLWLALALVLTLSFAALAGSEPQKPLHESRGIQSSAPRGGDSIRITRVTPRTGADLPLPVVVPYHLEVTYTLNSSPRGALRAGVFEWSPGWSRPRPLIEPVNRPIEKGRGTLVLTTPPASISQKSASDSQVLAIVRLKGADDADLGYSLSYNFLAGQLLVREADRQRGYDEVKVLSLFPSPGGLRVGQRYTFSYGLSYTVVRRDFAFLNMEVGSRQDLLKGTPYYSLVVPLPRGAGVARVKTRELTLPPSMLGQELWLDASLRVDPLGGTWDVRELGPWRLLAPR